MDRQNIWQNADIGGGGGGGGGNIKYIIKRIKYIIKLRENLISFIRNSQD